MDSKFNNFDYSKLNPYVKEIFSFQSHQTTGTKSFKFYADGLPGIMFQQSENGMFLNGENKKLSPLFVYGQTIKPIEIICHGPFRMIIFYLYPPMLKMLFEIQASDLIDSCLNFADLKIEGSKEVLSRLESANYIEDQIKILETFILSRVPEPSKAINLSNAIKCIEMHHDSFSISSISDNFNVSPRTFQRIFKQYVGISPRLYARVSKFNKAINLLESGEYKLLTELAFETEYSDQSHFTRTFKEFTGLTPKAFIASLKKA